MKRMLRPALSLFLLLAIITGVIYPLLVSLIAGTLFPSQVAGNLIARKDEIVGSSLIGQNFVSPRYFWGRPSATGPYPYNAAASSGSNQGPLNPALTDAVKSRIAALKQADPTNTRPIPVDLVTASASGLDPQISPAAARYQTERIAKARGLPVSHVEALITRYIEKRQWGVFGEPRVNVLNLNLALDEMK